MLGKITRAIARRGLIGSVRIAIQYALEPLARYHPRRFRKRFLDWRYDRRHNVDTSTPVNLDQLHIEAATLASGKRYQPTTERSFHAAMASLPIEHREFVFVDFGSGKGKCLFMASDYPFQKIIGVEFSAELAALAQRNAERYHSPDQKCRQIESVACDAAAYEIPPEPGVYYFYNPFEADVLQAVCRNVQASLRARPRPAYILYYTPVYREVFDAAEEFALIHEAADYCIYVSH